jgi:hypothetical protein
MAEKLSDPVFGSLKWDGIWFGQVADSAFGKKVPLSVVVFEDLDEPSAEQRAAFARYRENESRLLPDVERLLFEYYEKNKDEYRAMLGRSGAKKAPDLEGQRDVWKVYKCRAIVVPIQSKKKGRVVLVDFTATFDSEHGSRVFVQDEQARKLIDPGAGL